MENFPCPYFTFETRYPESGSRMILGKSYQYDTLDPAPDQRTFLLTLPGLQYFCDENGDLDLAIEPERNIAVLDAFYNQHRTAIAFNFEHPAYGPLVCKFKDPFAIPQGIKGGNGVLQDVRVSLVEIP